MILYKTFSMIQAQIDWLMILATIYCCLSATKFCNCNQTTAATQQELNSSLQLKTKLESYTNRLQFDELSQKNYPNNLEWARLTFNNSADSNRYIYLLVSTYQLEISARNYAIRRFLLDILDKLFGELYDKPLEYYANNQTLRDVSFELIVARAKLRAKITMIRANEYHWSYLYDLMTLYGSANNRAMDRLNSTMPRESLDIQSELEEQTNWMERYYELRRQTDDASQKTINKSGLSSYRVLKILDKLLDRWLDCESICEQLVVPGWSAAGPLNGNFMLSQWTHDYIDANLLQSIEDTRREIAAHIRLSNMYDLKLNKRELIEQHRKETLGLI